MSDFDLTDHDLEDFLLDTFEPHAFRICRACGHEFGDHVAGDCPPPRAGFPQPITNPRRH